MTQRLVLRAAVLLLAVLAGCLAWPGVPAASAHAVLLRSDPAQNARLSLAPSAVDLFFSEPLNRSLSSVQVNDTAGGAHVRGGPRFTGDPTEMTAALAVLQPGFYTVAWTTVSAVDGHRLQGTFPFTVLNADGSTPAGSPAAAPSGNATPGVQPLDAALRWLLLLGLIGLSSGFGFAIVVSRPAAQALPADRRIIAARVWQRVLLVVVLPAGVVVLVINLAVLLREAAVNGSLGSLSALLQGTAGAAWIARELLPLLCIGTAGLLARGDGAMRPSRLQEPGRGDRRRLWETGLVFMGLGLGLLALLTMSLTSHAAAGNGADWAVPADFLHLAALSLWLGGVVQLPLLPRAARALSQSEQGQFLGTALRRFSPFAVCCVGLVLLSGTFNALVEIPSWQALWDTAYGRALLIKLVLVAALLALGLLNAVRIARKFEREALANAPGFAAAGRSLGRSAVVESIAGAIVVAAAAVMVFFVPSAAAVAQRSAGAPGQPAAVSSVYRNAAPASDLSVGLTVAPNRVGDNEFDVLLSGPDLDKVTRVQLRFQFSAASVGQSTVEAVADPATAGLFRVTAANFSFVGLWHVSVNVLRNGHDDVNGNFAVEVPDATGATTATQLTPRSAGAFPAHGITVDQAWGAIVVAGGGLLFVLRNGVRRVHRWAGVTASFSIAGAAVVGVTVIAMSGPPPGSGPLLANPVPADQRSVGDGQALYAANCAKCHGATGHGDGPLADGLNPRPFDLTVHVGLHPDGLLFAWISNGIPHTAMPAWNKQLDPQQRWDLINYLRTLSVTAQQPAGSPTGAVTVAAAPGH